MGIHGISWDFMRSTHVGSAWIKLNGMRLSFHPVLIQQLGQRKGTHELIIDGGFLERGYPQ
jgi:hypothetical protein